MKGLLIVLAVAVAAFAQGNREDMASPGTVNYIEGQVTLNGQELSAKSAEASVAGPNQVISTADGYAEILLTPGAFLRVGHNSEVRFLSAGLASVDLQLNRGEAIVEVSDLVKGSKLEVITGDVRTQIEKKGLYDFDANQRSVRVLDGKAEVRAASGETTLKKGDQVLLASDQPLKKRSFELKPAESEPLYVWNKVRSHAESQANVDAANAIAASGGYGPGWYWNPFWSSYAFVPGWGFYSPGFVYGGGWGFRGGHWGHGYHGRGFHGGHGGFHGGHGGFHGGGHHR